MSRGCEFELGLYHCGRLISDLAPTKLLHRSDLICLIAPRQNALMNESVIRVWAVSSGTTRKARQLKRTPYLFSSLRPFLIVHGTIQKGCKAFRFCVLVKLELQALQDFHMHSACCQHVLWISFWFQSRSLIPSSNKMSTLFWSGSLVFSSLPNIRNTEVAPALLWGVVL